MKTVNGWAFPDADEFMVSELHGGRYQIEHLAAALSYVKGTALAIDGGAHVGTWSRVMARTFDRVIAVEPSPDTYEALAANLAAFGCANVEPRQVALGAAPGRVLMALDAENEARKNTGARHVEPGGTIPLETIDGWQLPALDFLKLDVEGSEAAALLGARETLLRHRPIVLYEEKGLARRHRISPAGPEAFLRSIRYRLLQVVGCDRIWGPA